MNLDIYPFKCTGCKSVTAQRLLRTFDCQDVPDSPAEVWLIECQRCFEQRIIYPAERVASKEDDIIRCQCGQWKLKSTKCRVCSIANGSETIKRRVFTGHTDLEVDDLADL